MNSNPTRPIGFRSTLPLLRRYFNRRHHTVNYPYPLPVPVHTPRQTDTAQTGWWSGEAQCGPPDHGGGRSGARHAGTSGRTACAPEGTDRGGAGAGRQSGASLGWERGWRMNRVTKLGPLSVSLQVLRARIFPDSQPHPHHPKWPSPIPPASHRATRTSPAADLCCATLRFSTGQLPLGTRCD